MTQLHKYLTIFRRSWWIVSLAILAALNIALVLLYFAEPIYRTSAQFIVSPGPSLLASENRDLVDSIETLGERSIVATYAEVMGSGQIHREMAEAVGLSPQELSAYHITAVVLPDASVLELAIEGPDPAKAALLANEIGQRAIDYIKELYLVYDIHVLNAAIPPLSPIRPQPMRDIGLAVVLGSVFGLALAVLREQVSPASAIEDPWQSAMPAYIPLAFNRRHFAEQLEEELASGRAEPLSLGLVQLKGLQGRLETLPAPQQVIQRVAEILHDKLRSGDTIGHWDETSFAILLPMTNETAALQKFENIQQALAQPLRLDHEAEALYLDPHTGIAMHQRNEPADILIKKAEAALNETYRNGTKTVLFSQIQPINGTAVVLSKSGANRDQG